MLAALLVAAALLTFDAASNRLWAVTVPTLTIPTEVPADYGQTVRVPVTFEAGGKNVVAVGFSLDINPACLSFNVADANNDLIYDAVIFHTPAGVSLHAGFSLAEPTSELDLAVYSLAQVPDGLLVEIEFGALCQPPVGGYIITPVAFSTDPRVSFGLPTGQPAAGTAVSGSVRINRPLVPVSPVAPTFNRISACGTDGSVTFADTPGVTYAITQGDGKQGPVTVSATAIPGYVLQGDIGPWSDDLGTRYDCPVVVMPVRPTVTVIDQCGEWGSVVFASTTGVTYSMEPENATEGWVTVTATAQSGHVLDESYTAPWIYYLGMHYACPTVAIPVPPTVTVIDQCGEVGSVVFAETEGVAYSMVPPNATEGIVTVSAAALSGFVLDANYPSSWEYDLGTYLECVIPVAPTFTHITTCGTRGSVAFAITPHVTYAITEGDGLQGAVTVEATADPGYGLKDYTGPWSDDLGTFEACPGDTVVIPEEPEVTRITTCGTTGSVVLAETEGITYTVSPANPTQGSVTVAAAAKPGYVLDANYPAAWQYDLGTYQACPTVAIPVEPNVTRIAGCGTRGAVAFAITPGVTYSMEPPNATEGVVTVTATAKANYVLAESYDGPWEYDLGTYVACPTAVTPVKPIVTKITTCGTYGSVAFATTPGVTYSMVPANAKQGIVTVSATAKAGFVLDAGYDGPWEYDLGTYQVCPTAVTPVEPTVTKITTCGTYGSVVFATTPGVTYSMVPDDATQGEVTVSAAAKAGFALQNYTGPWHYDLGTYQACPEGAPEIFLPLVLRLDD